MFKQHRRKTAVVVLALLGLYYWCLPNPLFDDPTCMVLEDREGQLLGARIAADGQWRFPYSEAVPEKFATALIEFEDKRFYQHWGVDPISIARAFRQNLKAGEIVSGGSTLSMQLMRISRKGKKRNVWQKLIEMILATRLEWRYSKAEILALYASHAPFGGNVVGIEAASWRYYAKRPELLSWAEAATLAVLPNSPSLIHPGRNRDRLLAKRNRLLQRLIDKQALDPTTGQLAMEEPLPDRPLPLPRLAPHLLDRAYAENFRGQKNSITRIQSTVDRRLQRQANEILQRHQRQLRANGIYNAAALVVDVESGNVMAYVGNTPAAGKAHGEAVDIIPAPRSTGSIMKPFLYSMMLQEGQILPGSLVPDVPTYLSGYRPANYYETYDGVVTARRALIRSLNVPFVRLLQRYGLEKFHFGLRQMGLSHLRNNASHYGLPLVLGGAEASLWDITNAYTNMARGLRHFYDFNGRYDPKDQRDLNYNKLITYTPSAPAALLEEAPVISAAASWLCFEAMQQVERPRSEGSWEYFRSSRPMAWKTGTSFGFRDAWAVGVTPQYVIGVWAGNADGEGRPGLIGVEAAAPILFDLARELDYGDWFEMPYDELQQLEVCQQSGYRALAICPKDTVWAPLTATQLSACRYHRQVHLDASGTWQVHANCEPPYELRRASRFVLPPLEEYYYKSNHPDYQPLPPFRSDCQAASQDDQPMQLIYPRYQTQIYVPVELSGETGRTVFKVAHRRTEAEVHWHIDREFVGTTKNFHSFELNPVPGKHTLTVVDDEGHRLSIKFEVMGRRE
ncbi:MAG: penicillin-binding protein 1C [Bacteroidota bacterium]